MAKFLNKLVENLKNMRGGHEGHKCSLPWHLCSLVQITRDYSFTIFCARKRNLLQQRSDINMYDSLYYFHDDRNNCNKNMLRISILRTVFLLTMPGSNWNKYHQLSTISTSNKYKIFLISTPGTQETFVNFFHGIDAADTSWYSDNEWWNGSPSFLSLLDTSEENTHYMLVSIGVAPLSNNESFRFLNGKMAELIANFKVMERCDVTSHRAVGHKSRKIFSVLVQITWAQGVTQVL